MKKLVTLFICLFLGVSCLSGCGDKDETFTQKSYTAEEKEISKVCIDVRDRQIEVMPSKDNQIHIDYFENSKEYYDISVFEGNSLTMTAKSDKEWTDYVGGKGDIAKRKILLQLPNKLLTELKLSTTNESISLVGSIAAYDISLSSKGGNVVFNKLDVGNSAEINAKNSDIKGSIIGSYDDFSLFSQTKKGKSNLPPNKDNGAKKLTFSNNNGDIEIEFISE